MRMSGGWRKCEVKYDDSTGYDRTFRDGYSTGALGTLVDGVAMYHRCTIRTESSNERI